MNQLKSILHIDEMLTTAFGVMFLSMHCKLSALPVLSICYSMLMIKKQNIISNGTEYPTFYFITPLKQAILVSKS